MPKPLGIKMCCDCGNRAFVWSMRSKTASELQCTNCHCLYLLVAVDERIEVVKYE